MSYWAKMHDNPLRWLVRSSTKETEFHMVDLAEADGRGTCTCEDYTFRISPYIEQGRIPPGGRVRCRHISIARDRLVQVVINKMERSEW